MISLITPTQSPRIVAAHGPLFDFDHVVDMGFRMLRRLVAVRRSGSMAEVELITKVRAYDLKADVDIADDHFIIEASPYQIDFCPCGAESLRKTADGYRTSDDRETRDLDATPTLRAMLSLRKTPVAGLERLIAAVRGASNDEKPPPVRGEKKEIAAALKEHDHAMFREAWSPFERQGIELKYGQVLITARFPHAVFGRGFGPVRVKVA